MLSLDFSKLVAPLNFAALGKCLVCLLINPTQAVIRFDNKFCCNNVHVTLRALCRRLTAQRPYNGAVSVSDIVKI